MGRPKLPKGQHRESFSTRFTRAELDAFESAAKAKGMELREWITCELTEAAKDFMPKNVL